MVKEVRTSPDSDPALSVISVLCDRPRSIPSQNSVSISLLRYVNELNFFLGGTDDSLFLSICFFPLFFGFGQFPFFYFRLLLVGFDILDFVVSLVGYFVG